MPDKIQSQNWGAALALHIVEKLVRNANYGTMLYLSEPGIRNKLAIKLQYKIL